MWEQMGDLSREMETIKMSQMEMSQYIFRKYYIKYEELLERAYQLSQMSQENIQ